jgi:GT2 family glycosyltransferase/uncharacterized protein YbaR (Trm112 family)/SAM-dependent methyltransferase
MDLYDILACPVCKVHVERKGDALHCPRCGQVYPIIDGVPVLFPGGHVPQVQHEDELVIQSDYYPWVHRVILQSLLDDQIAVDVGCGNMGLDDPAIIRLDVTRHPYADLVADVHALPFLPGSVDYIFSLAVVEHLRQPFEAARSMYQALKDGGYIYHECNFVFAYHGYPHHYFNASLQGMEQVFAGFEHLRKGVAPYQMPSFAILMLLDTYLRHTRAGDYPDGRRWKALLEHVIRSNAMWYDGYFTEQGALNVAAGTYLSGFKQEADGASLIPEPVRRVWEQDPALQARFPNVNDLTTTDNLLVWAREQGRGQHPQIDAYLRGLTPFNKRGEGAPWDRSELRSWPLVEPVFGAHPSAEPPQADPLLLEEGAQEALQAQIRDWEQRWTDLESGAGWKLLKRARTLRLKLAPIGSRRERILRMPLRALRLWRSEGAGALGQAALRRVSPGRRSASSTMPVQDSPVEVEKPVQPAQDTGAHDAYRAWAAEHAPDAETLQAQHQIAEVFPKQPLIGVLLAASAEEIQALGNTLASLQEQSYPNWQSYIAGPAGAEIQAQLPAHVQADERIHYLTTAPEAASVACLQQAFDDSRTDLVLFMQPGDRLSPQAFYQAVYRLNDEPRTDLIYFDEDWLAPDGIERHDPLFKPDWSPELMLSLNYIGSPLVRRSLVQEAGGLDAEMQDAYLWDLALRCSEKTEHILHIPQVLYHRSAHSEDLAPQTTPAQRCLVNHLARRGIQNARIDTPAPGQYHALWPLKGDKVSVIIPTKNRLEMLEKCLPPLLEDTDYPDFEVILVDNDSDEAVQDYYRRLQSEYAPERLRVVDYPGQFNYNTANNLGASQARGELLLFLNNDIQALDSGWLKEMSRWAERPEIGAVGAKLLYPQGTIQHAGVVMGMGAYAGHVFFQAPAEANGPFGSVDWYRDYNAVTAACLMTRRQVFEETGGFDESYQLAMSDVELCLRIRRAGYRIMYTPYARLIHYEGSTRSGHIPALDLTLAYLHMREYVQDGDPYYNPNLSYAVPIPTLKPNAELPRLERFERFYRAYAQTGVPASPAE